MDAAGDKLMQELRDVVSAAEELLAAGSPSAERMKEIRDRADDALRALEEKVGKNPWAAVGIAAGIGLIVGLLLSRK
jgi:ElaB/YqjD/DUF883 family membrane-anchored ribosome-binding protein